MSRKAVLGWLLPGLMALGFAKHAAATVFIITPENASFAFEDQDAAFGGIIPAPGIRGKLRQAIPIDGCEPFLEQVDPRTPTFALIARGNCLFDVKVLNAQLAGFSGAIVFNNEEGRELVTMSGRRMWEIYIPAVFVTLNSGKQMLSLIQPEMDCFIIPTFDNAAWSVMTASLISLIAVAGVLTTFLYVRRHRLRQLGSRFLSREQSGMLARDVKALPTITFSNDDDVCSTMETCAICLEDYEINDNLRLLPCHHEFHVPCIDQWLLTRRPFCPVCKRDARVVTESATLPERPSFASRFENIASMFHQDSSQSPSSQPFLGPSVDSISDEASTSGSSQPVESTSDATTIC